MQILDARSHQVNQVCSCLDTDFFNRLLEGLPFVSRALSCTPLTSRLLIAQVSWNYSSPSSLEIIMEASPSNDPSRNDIFVGRQANGFVASELANSYDFDWYLRWRQPTPLRCVKCSNCVYTICFFRIDPNSRRNSRSRDHVSRHTSLVSREIAATVHQQV